MWLCFMFSNVQSSQALIKTCMHQYVNLCIDMQRFKVSNMPQITHSLILSELLILHVLKDAADMHMYHQPQSSF